MTSHARPVVFLLGLVVAAAVVAGARGQAPSSTLQLQQVAHLSAANADMSDHFACGGSLPGHIGNGVAISADGNTIAVGAPHESSAARGIDGNPDDNSLHASGAVYVFVRSGDGWVQQAYVKASNAGQSDLFGMTVALSADGNLMAVAAPWERSAATGINGNQDDDSIPQAGAVYLFARSGETWSQQAYVKASNTGRAPADGELIGDGDQFGFSLTLSGDGSTMAVGAVAEDSAATGVDGSQADDSGTSAGAVYVFTRTGNSWAQQAYLKGSNTEGGDLFGYGVGLSHDGRTLAVSAYDEDGSGRAVNPTSDNELNGTGAVYAFSRTGDTWREMAYMKGSRSQRNDALGYAVAISADGNTIVGGTAEEGCLVGGVNPSGCDVDTVPEHLAAASAGAAYVWVRNGDRWMEQAFLKASNPDLEDWFGVRLAVSGDGNTLLVGAPNEDSSTRGIDGGQGDNTATESGAAYLFTRTGTTWSQRAYIKADNADAFDEFGSSIAMSRDGRTLLVGARAEAGEDNGTPEAGAAYVLSVSGL